MTDRDDDIPRDLTELTRWLQAQHPTQQASSSGELPVASRPKRRTLTRGRFVSGLVATGVVVGLGALGLAADTAYQRGLIPGFKPAPKLIDYPDQMDWKVWKSAVNTVRTEYPALRGRGFSRDEVYEGSRDLFRRGVALYNTGSNRAYPVDMIDANNVQYFEDRYDLRGQGLTFATAALYAELARINEDPDTKGLSLTADLDIRRFGARVNLIDSDASPFLQAQNLAYLELLHPVMEKAGLGNPTNWKQTNGEQKWDPNQEVLFFTDKYMLTAWPKYHLTKDPNLAPELKGILARIPNGEHNVNLLTLPNGGYEVDKDELAVASIYTFVANGIQYRWRANALERMGSPNAAPLVMDQYSRLREFFKGAEYTYDGNLKQAQPEYSVGQLVGARNLRPGMIRDIRLARLNGDPFEPEEKPQRIQDRTVLELVAGPVRHVDTDAAVAVDYWTVTTGKYLTEGQWVSGTNYPRGRIPTENLGRITGKIPRSG